MAHYLLSNFHKKLRTFNLILLSPEIDQVVSMGGAKSLEEVPRPRRIDH